MDWHKILLLIATVTAVSCAGDGGNDGNSEQVLASDGNLTTDRNLLGSSALSSTNPNAASLTFSIVTNGNKGVATITDSATGDYDYDPGLNETGNDSFTFKVNDGSVDSNTATVSVTINDTPVLVFLASSGYQGNFGGLSGGDTNCTTLANGSGFPGPWTAWLSDSTADAIDRIHDGGPYQNLANDSIIANDLADLTDGTLDTNILNIAGGTEAVSVWTGTYPDGTVNPGQHCSDWTSTSGGGNYGTADFANSNWTQSGGVICDGFRRLYCFQ